MNGYSVKVKECSKALSAKERIMLKDTTDTIKLDVATQEAPVMIDVDYFATLDIHNEKSDDKDYETFVVVDKTGVRYTTGSQSFISAFLNIYEEMANETEPWMLKVYRLPSKNRQGKDFITCSIM